MELKYISDLQEGIKFGMYTQINSSNIWNEEVLKSDHLFVCLFY